MISLSPKKEFQKSIVAKTHAELVTKPEIHASLIAALSEMQKRNGAAPDMPSAAALHYRNAGAIQFIGIWLNLAEPEIERKPPTGINLEPQ